MILFLFFSTDNGPEDPHIDMHAVGDPGPFRGRKRSLYEGGIRVPFIASWPGHIPQNAYSDADVMSADWLPTVVSLAGISLAPQVQGGLMGRDASKLMLSTSVFRGAVAPRSTPVMWDYRFDAMGGYCWHAAPRLAIRDWKTNAPDRQGQLKLLMNLDRSRVELYNLSENTFEANDLSKMPSMQSHVARLSSRLLQWAETLGPLGGAAARIKHMGCLEWAVPSTPVAQETQWRPEPFD